MPEMINHIFKSIHVNENAIENAYRILRNQARFNRNVTLFTVMTVACLYIQDRQIAKLTSEVNKLKRVEAEGE